MSEGPPSRISTSRLTRLTKAQRKVLDALLAFEGLPVSTRDLARVLSLSRRTVQAAVHRLDHRDVIRIRPGGPTEPNRYRVEPSL